MKLSLKALLLAGAVLFFILAIFVTTNSFKLSMVGLALFAGAFLLEETGIGKRRLLR
jgi:hypothetical protein